ncbi:purine-cytosine permease family protein [Microbispora sp. ATCC PTA-5024]|uniref:purine-cytosine permease family protein n=1 Tax=Microbispora sp. ATCC PTA-5024 TaxID=316330 RepID=UPI0003DDA784|nr:cytosine permease [Microbispora sp. ATCC PTA-5024]ETK35803.1 cytosine permease [Microbispora sp. ATCC PTA-5024]
MTVLEPPAVAVREGSYGDKVAAIEPGGVEFIPLSERHGRPRQLFWTWMSPNMEFATIFLGVLAVAAFGLGFWAAVLAVVVGTGLGAAAHGVLSARGPSAGLPQMVLGRLPFGYRGNILPSAVNSVAAGIGWFAVNSVSGALALNTLTGLPAWACLLIVVAVMVALGFFGHNLVQAFERYAFPVLAVIFAVASAIILSKAQPGHAGSGGGVGGFLLTVGATFGYAAGWNPYAADYTRYLPAGASRRATGLAAGLGVFVSCVILEIVGAASVTIGGGDALGQPTSAFTGHLPTVVADLTLLAIALGAISANALNVYSGAMSLLALGVRLPLTMRRAIVALACGVAGFLVALSGLDDAGHKYEAFLLVIAYWIGPWLGVVLTDMVLRRGRDIRDDEPLMFDRGHANWAGPVAMVVGVVLSVWLFSNQEQYVGLVPKRVPAVGDIAFEVGFLISAAVYLALKPLRR